MYEEQSSMGMEESFVSTSPRPFSEVPSLWMQVTHMTEDFFTQEAPRASASNTLISVLILAAVTAVFSAITSLISAGIQQMVSTPAAYRGMGSSMLGSMILGTACCGLAGGLIGFYLSNGMVYLAARVFGGSGDFNTQAYLQSLFAVPLGIASSLLSVVSVIPTVGGCAFAVVALALGIYSIVLNVRAIKVTHNLSTGTAVVAMFAPAVLLIGVACLIIFVLALMGPAIGNVFENIVLNI